jgi:hypothetical protein
LYIAVDDFAEEHDAILRADYDEIGAGLGTTRKRSLASGY